MAVALGIFDQVFLVFFFRSVEVHEGRGFNGQRLIVVCLQFCQCRLNDGGVLVTGIIDARPVLHTPVVSLPIFRCGVDGAEVDV